MTDTPSALDKVMGQAQDAAANFQAPTLTPSHNTNLTQTGGGNQLAKPSLATFVEAGGMKVDLFLTIKEGGFQLGDMKKYFDDMLVELDMTKVIPIYSARGEAGGNTKFIKSYDGVSTPQGQNFQQAVAHLEATTKCTGIYQTAEIPVTLLEDVKDTAGTVVKAGTTVGITPSLTGFSEFQAFVAKLIAEGRSEDTLKVKVSHKLRSNRNNNSWGVADYALA